MSTNPEQQLSSYRLRIDLAGLLIAIGGVVLLGVFVWSPLHDAQRQAETEIARERLLLDRATGVHARHADMGQKLVVAEQRLTHLLSRIPDSADEAGFLAQVAELAAHSQLEILDFQPRGRERQASCSAMRIELAVQGSYEQICRFVAGLDRLPRLCRVQKMEVLSTSPNSETYPVDLELLIFFAPLSTDDTKLAEVST